MKTTKKSLLASGLALLICAALLVGTTFAWFTDSVTNKGNSIQAGSLLINAYAYDLGTGGQTCTIPGVNNGQAFTFEATAQDLKTDATPIISEQIWEPGASSAKLLQVTNDGTLAAKIKLQFATSGDLTDALWFDFIQIDENGDTVGQFTQRPMNTLATFAENLELPLDAGATVRFVLVYGMYTTSGSEYMGDSFTADVTVLATQNTKEADGFGNTDYDQAATYPASTLEEVVDAINQAEDGDTIALTNKIVLDNPITIDKDITINGLGNGIITNKPITATADVTFTDVELSAPTNDNKNATLVYAYDGCEELVFDGVTFADPQWEAIQITSAQFKNLVVNNCTFTAANVDGAESSYGNAADEAIRYIHIQPKVSDNVVANITITNNTFKNCDKVVDSVVGIYYIAEGSTLTIGNNTIENCTTNPDGTSDKLCFGWPQMKEASKLSDWEGALQTFTYTK